MKTELMKITPEIAKEMLERNTHNRKISMVRVNVYADDMARGGGKQTVSRSASISLVSLSMDSTGLWPL